MHTVRVAVVMRLFSCMRVSMIPISVMWVGLCAKQIWHEETSERQSEDRAALFFFLSCLTNLKVKTNRDTELLILPSQAIMALTGVPKL